MFTEYKQPTGIVSSVSSIAVSTAIGTAVAIRGVSQIIDQGIKMGLNEMYASDSMAQLQNVTEFLPNKLEALKSLQASMAECDEDDTLKAEYEESIAILKSIKMKRV